MLRHEGVGREREALERGPRAAIVPIDPSNLPCYLQHLRDSRLASAYVQPIVSGGTGLYLRALLQGLFHGPQRSAGLRAL